MGVDHFLSTLDSLVGFNVNLYVGENVYKGKLIGVESDHVIIENENNYIFYYNINQIQAITKNTKQFQGEETTTDYLKTQSLRELLQSLANSWVTIFCIRKQKFTGILTNIGSDYLTLINGSDGILIQLHNVSNVIKGELKENENTESEEVENQTKAQTEQLSYASPVVLDEELVSTQEIEDAEAASELKHKASIENGQQKPAWSQPIKKSLEEQKEMISGITAEQEETISVGDVPEYHAEPMIQEEMEQTEKNWSQPIKNFPEEQLKVNSTIPTEQEESADNVTLTSVTPKYHAEPIIPEVIEQHEKDWAQPVKMQTIPEKPRKQEKNSEEVASISETEQTQAEPSIKVIKEEMKQPGKVWSRPIKNNNDKLNEAISKKMKKEKTVNNSKMKENKKPVKEIKATQKQETKTGNKAQEASLDKKNEPRQTEQPVRAFRFLGEPIPPRELNRPTIFDGWFSRNRDPRF